MFSIDSKDFTIASAARITIRDYSNYDPDKCHDGGSYKTGVTFIRHADGWERQEYTSGDYCPYCGSFDCCGSCEEAEAAQAERLTDSEVMDEVNHYKGQAGTAIRIFLPLFHKNNCFSCFMLERRIEEVDDDYAEWKAGERGW